MTFSAALPGKLHAALTLTDHLLRPDGQEDVCLAIYAPSTGTIRSTALVAEALLPEPGERAVHGNASFSGDYFLRAAKQAAAAGGGVAALHSHPHGAGWQGMSGLDFDTERSYAPLMHELTGRPLVGLTLAGDGNWSCRRWGPIGSPEHAESVRVVDDRFRVTWNDQLRPVPPISDEQIRTTSAWGEAAQASIARIRVLVVGVSSVGLDVAVRLAATGIQHIGVMDFDTVELLNRDRMIGVTKSDVLLARSKVETAARLMAQAATARYPQITIHDLSICEPAGLAAALDYDIIVSCVDRPWARGMLNTIAYADLVPVIDAGIGIDTFGDGLMRNAVWRSHVLTPGQPCMVCNGQLDASDIQTDKLGLFDKPDYLQGAEGTAGRSRQNVAILAASVSASILAQFVSFTIAPGGTGVPGPLRYALSTHTLEHLSTTPKPNCSFEAAITTGDQRIPLTGVHTAADNIRRRRRVRQAQPSMRVRRRLAVLCRRT